MGRLDNLRVVDPILTDIARGYQNEEFIGEKLFPLVQVDKSKGKIPLWGKDAFKVYDTKRALRADSNEIEGSWLTTDSYETQEHNLVQKLDYLEIAEAMLNLETHAVTEVSELIALGREKEVADLAQNLSTYPAGNKVTLTDDYYNEDAIDFIQKIGEKCDALSNKIGKYPNTCIIGGQAWAKLRFHPKLKTYLGVSISGNDLFTVKANAQKLAELLEIPTVLIGRSLYTTDNSTFTKIWGNNIILAYVTPPSGVARNIYQPCFGYTLRLKGNPFSDKWDVDNGTIRKVRTTDNYGIKVVGAESAYIINNPIDPSVYAA